MKQFLSSTVRFSGLFALAIILVFSSCEKDEGDSKNAGVKLAGKWSLQKEIYKDYEDGKLVDDETESYLGTNSYVEFKDGIMHASIKYTDGDTDGFSLPYTLSSDSKKIILTCVGEDCPTLDGTLEIRKLDSKNLILYGEETQKLEGVVYRSTTEIYLVR